MQAGTYKDRARSGTYLLFAQRVISFLLNLSQIAILSRLIAPSEFGLVAIALFFSTLFSVFRDFGLPATAIQLPYLENEQRDALFWFNILGTLILVSILLFSAKSIAAFYDQPQLASVLLVATINFLLLGVSAQHAAVLKRELRFKFLFIAEVGGLLLGWAATILLAYLFKNAMALVVGSAIQATFSACTYVILGGWIPRFRVHLRKHKSLLGFGANVATFSALNFLSNNLAAASVGLWSGSAAAGLFSRAQSLYSLPNSFILGPYLQVQFPLLCRIAHVGPEVRIEYTKLLTFTGLTFFTIGLALPLISRDLVIVLLGPSWSEVAEILSWLSPALFALGFTAPFGQFMTSQGRVRELRIWSLVELLIRGGGAVLGAIIGPTAAAAGFSIGTLFGAVPIMIWITSRRGPLSVRDQMASAVPGLLVALCTGTATFVTAWLLGHAGQETSLIRLTAFGFVVPIAWFSSAMALPRSRHVLQSIMGRTKGNDSDDDTIR